MPRLVCVLTLSAAVVAALPARGEEVADLLKDIRAAMAQGAGSPAARAAWDRLVQKGPAVLPRILEAMDTPDVVVTNWLRTAFDRIAEPELARGGKQIDADALLAFVRDARHEGRARRLALDVVERLRPSTRDRLLAGWLEDPEFHFEAVQRVLHDLDRDKNIPREKAVALLRRALAGTRDLEQGRTLAARLKGLGVTVSVADHFGFLRDWYVIGPFDGHGMKGFQTAYPPEQKVDLEAGYEGKDGKKLRWQRFTAPEGPTVPYSALVSLRQPLGDAVDAVGYAYTAFTAPADREVEFRGAADDNLSVWVNGEKVFAFEEYRNGIRLDRHRFRVRLRKGVNTVLVKVCQVNPEPNWEFILRVVDAAGRSPRTLHQAIRGNPPYEWRPTLIRRLFSLLSLFLLTPPAPAENWPGWRGPDGTGVSAETNLPVQWSATKNVLWKVPLPGAGVSGPVVWADRVFVTSSDGRLNDRLHLFCHHRDDGRLLWHARFFGSAVSEGQFPAGGMAVPTPATDGRRVYALFGTGDLVCVDFDGRPVWIRSLAQEYGPFRNRWGMAASPLLAGGLLVVQVDQFGESYLLGVDAASGANRWRSPRDSGVGWATPLAVRVGGKTQVVAAGAQTIKGYDADTGKELWTVRGLVEQCIPSPVAKGARVYALLGNNSDSLAIRLDGGAGDVTGSHVAWKVRGRGAPWLPSPVLLGDHYYYVDEAGWGNCLEAATGRQVWRERLQGKFKASPVAGDGKVYFASEAGVVTVVRAGPKFKVLTRNDLGEGVEASPAVSQGRIFLRSDKHLYCIGMSR